MREITQARVKRRITGQRKRLERDAPLFLWAGLASVPSQDEARAQLVEKDADAAAHMGRIDDFVSRLEARGQARRGEVALWVSPAQLEILDERRAILPASGEYSAGFWRWMLHSVLTADPDDPHPAHMMSIAEAVERSSR